MATAASKLSQWWLLIKFQLAVGGHSVLWSGLVYMQKPPHFVISYSATTKHKIKARIFPRVSFPYCCQSPTNCIPIVVANWVQKCCDHLPSVLQKHRVQDQVDEVGQVATASNPSHALSFSLSFKFSPSESFDQLSSFWSVPCDWSLDFGPFLHYQTQFRKDFFSRSHRLKGIVPSAICVPIWD